MKPMNTTTHQAVIWARCRSCTTWFHCPQWFDRNASAPHCPACGDEPDAIENRAQLARLSVGLHPDARYQRDPLGLFRLPSAPRPIAR